MKRLKFFFKGSLSERKYLTAQKNKGFILESVHHGFYHFTKNEDLKNSSLQIEFTQSVTELKDFANKPFVEKTVEKDLNFSNYKIVYSYLGDYYTNNLNVFNDTSDAEANYLKKIRKNLMILYQFSVLFFVLLMIILGMNESTISYYPVPIPFMLLTWIILLIFGLKLTKRIHLVKNSEPSLSPERTVIITYEKERPDIESALSYLGTWRYATSKKCKHHYRLTSQFSETQLKSDISSYLDINEEDVEIISNFGLAPIGYF